MQKSMVSKLLNKGIKPRSYLHAIIFIIDILDPRNELTSVEAISHRFVLITLAKQTMSQCRSAKYSPSVMSLVKKVSIKNALIIFLYIFLPGSLMAYCILQSRAAWCRR